MTPLVDAKGLHVAFLAGRGVFARSRRFAHALNGVDIRVDRKETVGVVGESGSGKTTLGRALLRLVDASAGTIHFDGVDIGKLSERALRPFRKRMQIVFQDPYGSLNPRQTVGAMLGEALRFHRIVPREEVTLRIAELLDAVGLPKTAADLLPQEFSGGQRQRIAIARALSVEPEFIVADEPVSALDASVRAQVANLLLDMRDRLELALLFVSHDLELVEHFCDRVVVMYFGKVVEELPAKDLRTRVRHPYSRALASAVLSLDAKQRTERILLEGDAPSPFQLPPGCAFAPRCALARPECTERAPALEVVDTNQRVACPIVRG